MGLLAVTIFIAPDIKGSRSWLVLGPVRLQPAEFAKVATSLTIAWLCNQYDFQIKSNASYLKLFGIILLPVGLILLQQETGSALVFLALFLALFREGFSGLFMGLSFAAATYFIGALILEDTLWWGETEDPRLHDSALCHLLSRAERAYRGTPLHHRHHPRGLRARRGDQSHHAL